MKVYILHVEREWYGPGICHNSEKILNREHKFSVWSTLQQAEEDAKILIGTPSGWFENLGLDICKVLADNNVTSAIKFINTYSSLERPGGKTKIAIVESELKGNVFK